MSEFRTTIYIYTPSGEEHEIPVTVDYDATHDNGDAENPPDGNMTINSIEPVGDWPDDSREAYLELKQAIAQEQEIARRCYTCKSFAIRNVDKCRSCNKDYSNWEPKP